MDQSGSQLTICVKDGGILVMVE